MLSPWLRTLPEAHLQPIALVCKEENKQGSAAPSTVLQHLAWIPPTWANTQHPRWHFPPIRSRQEPPRCKQQRGDKVPSSLHGPKVGLGAGWLCCGTARPP